MNAFIEESTAWTILQEYANACLEIDGSTLIALYAIGSLPGGYYRPGQSDIDAVLIVDNGSDQIWGGREELSKTLQELNRSYLERYRIPKDFGPFPLQERELLPPYDPEDDLLTLEIARLKLQGEHVYGEIDLEAIPLPTAEDFLAGARCFEMWWHTEFSLSMPLEQMSAAACVNTILIHLGRFLRIEKGILEFNKRKLVPMYLENKPPIVNRKALRLVEAFLESQNLADKDIQLLRDFVSELRHKMNQHLGISA